VILQTLENLPLLKPSVVTGLGADFPKLDVIQFAANVLEGPDDVCHGYNVIDPICLQASMGVANAPSTLSSDKTKSATVKWAKKWNDYVIFTCATSHLANAWDNLLRTVLTYCEPLFVDSSYMSIDDECLVDGTDILQLLKTLLFRLTGNYGQQNLEYGSIDRTNTIEPCTALPLSISCLSLIQKIFDVESRMIVPVEGDDLIHVISMLLTAIVSCDINCHGEEGSHNERAALLSCSLTTVLDSRAMSEASFPPNAFFTFQSEALKAGSYLSKLSSFSTSIGKRGDTNKHSITLAARSGLASLIDCFDLRCDCKPRDFFIIDLFAVDSQKRKDYLSQFIQLLVDLDFDITILLERIACCYHGTELLVRSGVTTALLSASTRLAQDSEFTFYSDVIGSETYGSIEVEPPRQLSGHFSLLNSLLASKSPSNTKQQILHDTMKFIEKNAVLGERLLTTYPKYEPLTRQFITCLYLLSRGLNGIGDRSTEGKPNPNLTATFHNETISRLQRRIVDLAFHIGQHPFPSKHLAPLPQQLRQVQISRIERLNVDVHVRNDKCWWDSITSNQGDVIVLPDPPFGSSDANFLKNSDRKSGSIWSDEKYHIATLGVQCLDLCLLFLGSQVTALTNPLNYDGLALAQALCRMSDAISVSC